MFGNDALAMMLLCINDALALAAIILQYYFLSGILGQKDCLLSAPSNQKPSANMQTKCNLSAHPLSSGCVTCFCLHFCLQILILVMMIKMMIKMMMKTGFSFLLEGLAGFPLFSVPVRHLLKAYLVLMIMLNFFLIFKTALLLNRIPGHPAPDIRGPPVICHC